MTAKIFCIASVHNWKPERENFLGYSTNSLKCYTFLIIFKWYTALILLNATLLILLNANGYSSNSSKCCSSNVNSAILLNAIPEVLG